MESRQSAVALPANGSFLLNLGCGERVVDGWTNVDYSLGARLAKWPGFKLLNKKLRIFSLNWDNRIVLHDLTKPFPWQTSSVSAIYSSHTLEHLSRADGASFVRECYRVLRPGGLIRILVPDLHSIVHRYTSRAMGAEQFIEALGVTYETTGRGVKSRLAPLLQYPHKCMYDQEALLRLLRQQGFDAMPRTAFESTIPGIDRIERRERTLDAVIVEGRKH